MQPFYIAVDVVQSQIWSSHHLVTILSQIKGSEPKWANQKQITSQVYTYKYWIYPVAGPIYLENVQLY